VRAPQFSLLLKLDLLAELKEVVPVPLVLHGGSGNPDSEIQQACQQGINKVNISSDIKHAYFVKMRDVLTDPTLREPHTVEPPCEAEVQEVVHHKNELFGALGRA
jgi:fructose-bisphosphate aldolase class II